MDRREAVQKVALLLGGAIIGAEFFVQYGCKIHNKNSVEFFTSEQIYFLDEMVETILPKTDTPGAKEANVGAFINVMVRDCYTTEQQKIFKDGIEKIQTLSKEKYGNGFMKITPEQKQELLTLLNKEQKEDSITKKTTDPKHYFRMIIELTLLGFFTSEDGASKTLRYAAVPGKYEPSVPYKKGEKAWYQA
jgi:hypothetical protein